MNFRTEVGRFAVALIDGKVQLNPELAQMMWQVLCVYIGELELDRASSPEVEAAYWMAFLITNQLMSKLLARLDDSSEPPTFDERKAATILAIVLDTWMIYKFPRPTDAVMLATQFHQTFLTLSPWQAQADAADVLALLEVRGAAPLIPAR